MRTTSHCIEAVSWIQNAVIQFGWLWRIILFWGLLFLSVKSTAKLSQGSAARGAETQKWGYSYGDCSAGVKQLKPNHVSLKFSVDWTNKKIILGQWLVSRRHSVSSRCSQRLWCKWRCCTRGQLVPHQAVGARRSQPSCAAHYTIWKVNFPISLSFLPWNWPCIWICLHRLPSSLTVFCGGDSSPTSYEIRAYITTLS